MNTLTSAYRDLKIRLLDEPIEFCIDKSSVTKFKHQLRFIKSLPPDCIITGSIALNLFGLIDRDIIDIDILIQDENQFSDYRKTRYTFHGDDANQLMINRLGYIIFFRKNGFFSKRRKFIVDFFKTTGNEKVIQFEFENYIYKVQNPLQVIACKMQFLPENATETYFPNLSTYFSWAKHYNDLTAIFNKL